MENRSDSGITSGGFKIGRIRDVDIKLHWSLLILLLFVMLVVSSQFFDIIRQSRLNIGMNTASPLLFGFIFAICLFLSVILHEFGHVLVAQRFGVKVKGVTLMMLGGVSEMGQLPDIPYAEFKLAVIGPIVSLALGGLMWVAYLALFSKFPKISLCAFWCFEMNISLGIFNLFPALALDGGRVLRSFLAAKQGNLKATENAVKVSRIFAWAMGFLGFLQFNFILVLIAFFIYMAAQSEFVTLLTQSVLKNVLVKEVMTEISPISENATIYDAVVEMLRTRNQVLPILSHSGNPCVLSLSSVREIEKSHWRSTPIKNIMERVSTILDEDEPVNDAYVEMSTTSSQAFPVKKKERITGILKFSDLSDIVQFKSIEGEATSEDDQQKAA